MPGISIILESIIYPIKIHVLCDKRTDQFNPTFRRGGRWVSTEYNVANDYIPDRNFARGLFRARRLARTNGQDTGCACFCTFHEISFSTRGFQRFDLGWGSWVEHRNHLSAMVRACHSRGGARNLAGWLAGGVCGPYIRCDAGGGDPDGRDRGQGPDRACRHNIAASKKDQQTWPK